MKGLAALMGASALTLATAAGAAQLTVGTGTAADLGTARLDMGCGDVMVDGTLSAGTVGVMSARDVSIGSGGVVNGESGMLELAGNWANAGTFNAGTSTVMLMDGCSAVSSTLTGSTTFANLDIATATGRQVSFGAGSTTSVSGALNLAGQSGLLLVLRSSAGGSAAFLNALGTSGTSFVDVDDIDATGGNPITLGAESVQGPNTPGWTVSAAVPVLTPLGLLVLVAALLWARRSLGREAATPA